MIAQALAFLFTHADLIEEVAAAIKAGVTKDALREAIRAAVIAVSDTAVEEEVGPL